ncbi:MAG: glycosyltransferase [Bacteroidota bacterium]
MSLRFSVVIPVFNRPDELKELLQSLADQERVPDEVVIVEDGSTLSSKGVVAEYADQLNIVYHEKENGGQGFARNAGYERASGDYFVVFDSDCIVPPEYFHVVESFLLEHGVDAYGGPDAAHPSFTTVQKAINHTMTSFFTTGGIRGRKQHVGKYHPRSFNMGISRKAFEKTKGYIIPFMGEDLEFSTRLLKSGFRTALIPNAFVYHKRRLDLRKFYKQLRYFGRARINLTRFHPEQISLIHLFPTVFTAGMLLTVLFLITMPTIGWLLLVAYLAYFTLILLEAVIVTKSISVALLTPITACMQLTGYGYGLVYEYIRKLRGIDPNTKYTELY